MKTQTKPFELRLIQDLINTDNFVNIIALENTTNAVEKYKNGIEQSMIYGVEDADKVIILENDIIQPLIDLLEEYRKEGNTLKPRRLANTYVRICLLDYNSTEEEKELFKQLVSKK